MTVSERNIKSLTLRFYVKYTGINIPHESSFMISMEMCGIYYMEQLC